MPSISRVSVIGAGTMGAGIAQVCAQAGFAVKLIDVKEEFARKGLATINSSLDRMVKKELVAARQVGNVWEYTPAVRPVQARRSAWAELVEKAFGGAVAPALQFLARDAKLSKKELAELRALLDAKDRDHD